MAKAAKKKSEDTAPKKKPLAAGRRKRKAKKAVRANPSSNPPAAHDFTHVILPGFAAYGITRVLQRIAFSLVGKRWPRAAKHAHAVTGVLAAGGAWLGAHKLPKVGQFHDSILMGSGIAALQGVFTAYVPKKYGWLLSDCKTADLAPPPPLMTAAAPQRELEPDEDDMSDLDAQLGSLAGATIGSRAGAADDSITDDDDLIDIDENDDDDLYTGAFGN